MPKHNRKKEFVLEQSERMRLNPTVGEENFINFCDRYGIKYHFQKPIKYKGKWVIPDFTFYSNGNKIINGSSRRKIIIEIDGEYHLLKSQKEKDKKRTELLKEKGYYVLRFFNHETSNEEEIRLKLKRFLKVLKEDFIFSKIESPIPFIKI